MIYTSVILIVQLFIIKIEIMCLILRTTAVGKYLVPILLSV